MGGRSPLVRRNIPGALPQTRRYSNVSHQPRDIVSDATISQLPVPSIRDTVAALELVLQNDSKITDQQQKEATHARAKYEGNGAAEEVKLT